MNLHELERILSSVSTHSTITDVVVKIGSESYFISSIGSVDGNFVLELFPFSPEPIVETQFDINDLLNHLNMHSRDINVFVLFESLFPLKSFSFEGTSLVLFVEPLKIGEYLFCQAASKYDFSSDERYFVGKITNIQIDSITLEHVIYTDSDLAIPVDYEVLLTDSFVVKRGPHRVIRQLSTDEFSTIQRDTKRFLYLKETLPFVKESMLKKIAIDLNNLS